MQRYFVSKAQIKQEVVEIIGTDAHHLMRVLRAKAGDAIIVSDGSGTEVVATIKQLETEPDRVIAVIKEHISDLNEPLLDVWIAQSMPKGDKFETVIQKCTELGAVRFIPFTSERTVVRYDHKREVKKRERWHKIIKEAAEQSHRSFVPVLEEHHSWNDLLDRVSQLEGSVLFCFEQTIGTDIKNVLQNLRAKTDQQARPILLIVGPEGGFSDMEHNQAKAAGAKPVSLGPRILRTETAAMAALTCILYEFDEMGGK